MSMTYLPLEVWNKHWQLDGPRVCCRACRRAQDLTDAAAFIHAPGYKLRTVNAQYPSRELAMVLQEKIRLDWF